MVLTDCTWALTWSKAKVCLSCAYMSQTFSSYFEIVPCLIWSKTLHTGCSKAIFVLVSWVLQYSPPDKPYYRTCCGSVCFFSGKICLRSEGGTVHLSLLTLLSEKQKDSCSNRTSDSWLLFYYLDVSGLMWAVIWEFPGVRLQLFPLYHLCFSSATGFYYSPIGNLRSAIHSEQIDGVLNLVVLRMYIRCYFGACLKSWSRF